MHPFKFPSPTTRFFSFFYSILVDSEMAGGATAPRWTDFEKAPESGKKKDK